ncbi:MAG: AgmX/PglI C-terminal domain-containing protein [Pseudomonadota bacterium]|nr:MAG: hypothetical protein DIU72_04235 [Pseudomonadota bacterium]
MRERATTRWVFKVGDELFGPVDAEYLEERLRAGEIGPETLVAPEHGPFAPIGTVEPFVALAAEVAVQRRREAARHSARRRLWLGLVAGLVLAVAGVAALLGREDPLSRRELQAITIEALPMEVRVVDPAEEDEEVYADSTPGRTGVSRRPVGAPASRPGPAARETDDLSIETRYDAAAIERVVASRRDRLLPCLRAQAQRDSAFRGEVPLSFVVGNDGKVARLWVDRVGYRDGPLHACLLEELRRWNFPSFEGQRPVISLRFRVGG